MAGRPKFKIPSAVEIDKPSSDEGKTFSLFRKYQQNKDKTPDETTSSVHKSSSLTTESSFKPSLVPAAASTSSRSTLSSAATSSSSSLKSSSSLAAAGSIASEEQGSKLSSGRNLQESSAAASTTTGVASVPALGTTGVSKSSTATSGPAQTSSSKPASSNSIIVNYRQRGNPILKHIRNIPWEYGSIVPDYVMGVANCALFLSLRYHQLHPEYLHNRLRELGKGYDLRVLLVQVDVKDPHHLLRDLAKICILADLTLILAFSPEEAGRYLEAYKVYENKPAEVLMEKTETDFVSKLTECLTTVKSVNKTDSMTLLSAFKSMNGIINASKEDISLCAGFGPQKAQRLFDVFHEPFLKAKRQKTTGDSQTASPVKKPR